MDQSRWWPYWIQFFSIFEIFTVWNSRYDLFLISRWPRQTAAVQKLAIMATHNNIESTIHPMTRFFPTTDIRCHSPDPSSSQKKETKGSKQTIESFGRTPHQQNVQTNIQTLFERCWETLDASCTVRLSVVQLCWEWDYHSSHPIFICLEGPEWGANQ